MQLCSYLRKFGWSLKRISRLLGVYGIIRLHPFLLVRGRSTLSAMKDSFASSVFPILLAFIFSVFPVLGVELTFELQDRDTQCFFEEITKGDKSTVEFQVVTGGHYDIDCTIIDPAGKEVYKGVKKEYDSHVFTAELNGAYQVCFGNEFSTFSHKLVYMDWYVGDEHPFRNPMKGDTVLTQLETSAEVIQNNLREVEDALTHRRLREAQDRKFAEDLNESTTYWSIGQSFFMLLCGLGQIWALKSFFTDKTKTHA